MDLTALQRLALNVAQSLSVDPVLERVVAGLAEEPGIVLEGTLDGQAIRFEFNSGEVFEAESESVTVPEGEVLVVVHTLDPGAWFAGVDGSALDVGEDGIAVISESSNTDAFDRAADLLDVTTDGRFPTGSDSDEE